jgi:hypothetical protein
MAKTSSPEVLRRWLGQLRADRRARSALIQSLSRQLQHLRERIRQAGDHLDGLTVGAMQVAGGDCEPRGPTLGQRDRRSRTWSRGTARRVGRVGGGLAPPL